MALPGPGTFSSLSAKTACYTYNWRNNVGGGAQTIVYTDCNGKAGITQSPGSTIGTSGSFCARSTNSPGGVSVDAAGNCPCITWGNNVVGYGGEQSTYSWLDCNGQPATKILTGSGYFYTCSNSKPILTAGRYISLTQTIEQDEIGVNRCYRSIIG